MYKKYAKLRDERGMTDYAVAKATGISTATMSSWRNEVYTPKADKLLAIAELFGVPLEYLLKEDE